MSEPIPIIPPKVVKTKILHEQLFSLRQDNLLYANGHHHDYYSLHIQKDAVSVIAETSDGSLIINREYRHPLNAFILSLPGGFIEEDATPKLEAQRELIEETGYDAKEFLIIGKAPPLPGICNQIVYYILAKEAHKICEPKHEPSELLSTELMSMENLMKAILEGEIVDGILCTAFFFYKWQI
ncbi:MAG: NUDIX hydrolase [Chlamydiales bacterium]